MGIDEIAKALGISKATVSLAINNKPGVSKETQKKVLDKVVELGYASHKIVKSSGMERTIKFLTCIAPTGGTDSKNNISSSFFSELIHSIEKECYKNAFTLSYSTLPLEDFEENLQKLCESTTFDATILLGTSLTARQVAFAASKLPKLVVLDTIYEHLDINFITMNNSMGGYKACSYLISLGHSNIGYIQSDERCVNINLRKEGFLAALAQNGLTISGSNYFHTNNQMELAQETLRDQFAAKKKNLPTALFCESDYIAIGAIKALKDCDIKVPEDVSVIGFDDVPEGFVIQPELTTIRVEKATIGSLAVRRLIEILKSRKDLPANKQIIDTYLVLRNSCCRPNTAT